MKKEESLCYIGTDYPSMTYRKTCGCGNLYITIAKDEDGKIAFIRIFGGNKSSPCGASFYETLGDMLTFSIRRIRNKHEAQAIVKNMRYHRCNNITPNPEHLVSCVDAIGKVLEGVLNVKEEKETTQTTTKE